MNKLCLIYTSLFLLFLSENKAHSVVFQEIRESKALAYSTFSRFRQPNKKEDPFSVLFYVGTQADKVDNAMIAINELVNNMPKSEKLWETSKGAIKSEYESKRITKADILFNYQNAQRLGLNDDLRKDILRIFFGTV